MKKYSRIYFVMTVVMAALFLFNLYIYAFDNSKLGVFRGAVIAEEAWSPLVAKDVNAGVLNVIIDNNDLILFFS